MKHRSSLAILALCTLCGWYSFSTPAGASARAPHFGLSLQYRGQADAPQLHDALLPQLNAIYRILGALAGRQQLRDMSLDIALYPDRESYRRYAETVTGRDMSNSGGFYRHSNNEAVTYMHSNPDKTFEFAKHESTHVMVTGMLGLTPKWLNEGLADYFSSLFLSGPGEEVREKPEWRALARQTLQEGDAGRLESLLSLNARGWNGADRNRHYALSWALVYFLMSSTEGKASIGVLLQQSAKRRARTINSVALLDKNYPGGWKQLQQDFQAWIVAEEVKLPHRYELH